MLLEALTLAFLSLIPFQWALSPSPGIDLVFGRVLALLIVAGWLIRGLLRRSLFLPPPLATGALLSFLVLGMLSCFWSEHPAEAIRKIFFLLNYFPLFLVFFDLGQNGVLRQKWLMALIGGSAVAALLGFGLFLLQFILGREWTENLLTTTVLPFFLGTNFAAAVIEYPSLFVNIGGETLLRLTAFFPDPHVASFYFGMTGLLALGLSQACGQFRWLIIGIGLVAADLLTFSRGGYVGLTAGLGFWFIWQWPTLSLSLRRSIVSVVPLSLFTLLVWGKPIISRFLSSFTLEDASSSERVLLWTTAMRHIIEQPLLGVGLGNYVFAVYPLAPERFPYYAHNLFLDLTVELGLVGLGFFLLLALPAWWALLRQSTKKTISPCSLAVFSGLLLFFVHSQFETALFSVHILPLLIFSLAWAWRDTHFEERDHHSKLKEMSLIDKI